MVVGGALLAPLRHPVTPFAADCIPVLVDAGLLAPPHAYAVAAKVLPFADAVFRETAPTRFLQFGPRALKIFRVVAFTEFAALIAFPSKITDFVNGHVASRFAL